MRNGDSRISFSSSLFFAAAISAACGLALVVAAGVPSANAGKLVPPRPASTQPAPIIHVDNIEHDFGDVWAGPDVKYTFEIHNRGNSTLKNTGVHPQCGCTTAGTYPTVIEPGKSGSFPFSIRTTGLRGLLNKMITISSNDPVTPNLVLRLRGNYKRRIETMPINAGFGTIAGDKPATRIIKIANNTETPLKLKLKADQVDIYKLELIETKAGKEFELRVTPVLPAKPGFHNTVAILQTSLADEDEVQVHVYGRVPERVDLYPPVLSYYKPTTLPAGRDYTPLIFTLANYGSKPVKITEANVDDSAITTILHPVNEGKNWRVEVRIPMSVVVPKDGRTLTVKTDDPEKPTLTGRIFPITPQPNLAQRTNVANPALQKRPAEYMLGQPVPSFSLTTFKGDKLSNEELRGKITVLNFISPVCPWCKKQVPEVEKVREKYQDKGVRFVNVINPNPTGKKEFSQDEITKILTTLNSRLEVAADSHGVRASFRATTYPTMFVVGKDAKIAAVDIGSGKAASLPAQLDALLAGKPIAASQPK